MNDVAKAILLGLVGGAAAELGHYLAGGVMRRRRRAARCLQERLDELEQLLDEVTLELAVAQAELDRLTAGPPAP
ncbi:hypothetical protein SAMN02745121_08571 [Nannocystis exedens]|uniref:Uncharacterized protein n=1 Tax=Nannocystis exedens TaxID=54 RepID=A0A1I2ICJ7_9BACT|nr:hypothetical protein [Nannocystis exedens]PCC73140.1 hypothetical protein NAEX_06228 [Nannocystis exedens]SFF39373.1 hypothetical protein SAMN02745121_08571 [Nannocystis exedens]